MKRSLAKNNTRDDFSKKCIEKSFFVLTDKKTVIKMPPLQLILFFELKKRSRVKIGIGFLKSFRVFSLSTLLKRRFMVLSLH